MKKLALSLFLLVFATSAGVAQAGAGHVLGTCTGPAAAADMEWLQANKPAGGNVVVVCYACGLAGDGTKCDCGTSQITIATATYGSNSGTTTANACLLQWRTDRAALGY